MVPISPDLDSEDIPRDQKLKRETLILGFLGLIFTLWVDWNYPYYLVNLWVAGCLTLSFRMYMSLIIISGNEDDGFKAFLIFFLIHLLLFLGTINQYIENIFRDGVKWF